MIAEWYTISEGDAGIAQTLARMRALALAGAREPQLVQLARRIVRHVDGHDRPATVGTIFDWFADHYVYTLDPAEYELVVAPAVMLRQLVTEGYLQGDCDDAVTLLAALLESVGIPTRFRVVSQERGARGDHGFSHVLLEAHTGGAEWVPLDVTLDGARMGTRPPPMPAEAIYDAHGLRLEGAPMLRRLGQFDFGDVDFSLSDPGGGGFQLDPAGFELDPGGWNLEPAPVFNSWDVGAGGGMVGSPVTTTMPSAGVTGETDWSRVFADVSGAVVRIGSAALPLLERYGALTPTPGSVPLQYPGETQQQYAARVAAGGFQYTLAQTPTSTWLLLGGGALLLVMMLSRGRSRR